MQQTWYLAVDMQLFLVSPLFVYSLWRWKKMGLALLVIITLASLASDFIVYALMHLQPTMMPTRLYS